MDDVMRPGIGRIVWYRTDGRNGLEYDLPAIVTCTPDTHPGNYPDGRPNPLPVPDEGCVHLTVFTPGGYGTTVAHVDGTPSDGEFIGAAEMKPGSGTYVELNVPSDADARTSDILYRHSADGVAHRTWRWPER